MLVSSHILGEVQQVADTVSIIGQDPLLASGTVGEVISRGTVSGLKVGVSDPQAATKVLVEAGLAVTPEGHLLPVDGVCEGAEISPACRERPVGQRAGPRRRRPGVGLPRPDT